MTIVLLFIIVITQNVTQKYYQTPNIAQIDAYLIVFIVIYINKKTDKTNAVNVFSLLVFNVILRNFVILLPREIYAFNANKLDSKMELLQVGIYKIHALSTQINLDINYN